MPTDHWVKKLSGHAGELFVAAELSKREIPNAFLPENFTDHDIMIGNEKAIGWIQVKSCHPDRAKAFHLGQKKNVEWINAKDNEFVAFVWLEDAPTYWIARMKKVGYLWKQSLEKFPSSQRLAPDEEIGLVDKWAGMRLEKQWRNDWSIFMSYKKARRTS